MIGSACGERGSRLAPSVGAFIDDEGGYTTVAMALSLLASVSLVFALALGQWTMARAADVQEVADAAALAGAGAVSSYVTVVRVIDACVLSLGLAGLTVTGAGLVLVCIPGAQAAGEALAERGLDLLARRAEFARSSYEGLSMLEKALPAIVIARSGEVVAANSASGIIYSGCALPFPLTGASVFSDDVGREGEDTLEDAAGELAGISREAEAAHARADAACERGWLADCGASPYCMRQRAETLAGLSGSANPHYPTPEGWTFGAALLRARAYYAARIAQEAPYDGSIESVTDSLCRRAFYAYAAGQLAGAWYAEHADGSVSMSLPELPRNTDEVRSTSLYWESVWPLSLEDEGPVLHSTLSCPGARGAPAGTASLADCESGAVGHCDACRMDVGDMGRVPQASTVIDNGFEHWWRELVRASRDYEQARNEAAAADGRLADAAERGSSAFDDALEELSVGRPKLMPPGAWGCVALVARGDSTPAPSALASTFASAAELPPGAAISAAVLAPDAATADVNLLASFFDGLVEGSGSAIAHGVDDLLGIWGELLIGYGSAYRDASDAASRYLDDGGLLGSAAASWLRERLKDAISAAGLEPVDMRLAKPVLTASSNVLSQAGYEPLAQAQRLLASLPLDAGPAECALALGVRLEAGLADVPITLARIPIPGTELEIPITVTLSSLGAAP